MNNEDFFETYGFSIEELNELLKNAPDEVVDAIAEKVLSLHERNKEKEGQ